MDHRWNSNVIVTGSRIVACIGLLATANAGAQLQNRLDPLTEIRPFAAATSKRFAIAADTITGILVKARIDQQVLKAISKPAEAMLWRRYRKIFMTRSRIDRGAVFWHQQLANLDAAEKQYGVPAEYIVAIIGVETLYGSRKGKYRVLDALATLGFRYPKRGHFFRSELQHYLLLAKSEKLDPLQLKGSYAGAMGIPQFIPSSYRHYAVDFDHDRVRDLIHSEADAIGSVANYLARHGWRAGGPVAEAAVLGPGAAPRKLQARGVKPHTKVTELRRLGVSSTQPHTRDPRAALIVLQGDRGTEYWLGFNNFYVITRYNHSPLYAMAVHQLAMAIKNSYSLQSQ